MVAWEVTDKEPTQVLQEAKEAVVSLVEMEATVAKVEMEGSELQAEMVVMAVMVETLLELLPSQHHLPTRVLPSAKNRRLKQPEVPAATEATVAMEATAEDHRVRSSLEGAEGLGPEVVGLRVPVVVWG